MQEINYKEILINAFFVSWKNKFLWLFGFLIFISTPIANLILNANNSLATKKFSESSDFFMFLGIIFLLYVLKNLSFAAIFRAMRNLKLYKQKNLVEILQEMSKYFLRTFKLDFSLTFILIMIFSLLAIPTLNLFSLKANFFAIISLVLASLILVSLFFLFFFIKQYAKLFVILGNLNFKPALEFAYEVFLRHKKESFRMGFLMLSLEILSNIIVLGSLLWLFSILFIRNGAFNLPEIKTLFSQIETLPLLILILIAILGESFFKVFKQIAWLDFFSQISMEKDSEKKPIIINAPENEVSVPEII